jgi:hypothetical protein
MRIVITEVQLKSIIEMSFKAHHGTPHDFQNFDLGKVGSGESTQWFGWGLYFTDSEDIANYYARSITDVKNKELISKSDLVFKGNIIPTKGYGANDLYLYVLGDYYSRGSYITSVIFNVLGSLIKDILSCLKGEKKWESIRFIGNREELVNHIKENVEYEINEEEGRIESREFHSYEELRGRLDANKKEYENFIKGTDPRYIEIVNKIVNLKREDFKLTSDDRIQKQGYTYNVTIHKGKTPDQYDYLSWYDDLTPNQKQKIINQIRTEKLKKSNFYIVKPISDESEVQPKFFSTAIDAKNYVKRWNSKNQIFGLGVSINQVVPVKSSFTIDDLNKPVKDFYIQLSGLLGSPKNASMFLLRSGIDGIKYPSDTISGGESRGTNYVIFDTNAVTIEKKLEKNL